MERIVMLVYPVIHRQNVFLELLRYITELSCKTMDNPFVVHDGKQGIGQAFAASLKFVHRYSFLSFVMISVTKRLLSHVNPSHRKINRKVIRIGIEIKKG